MKVETEQAIKDFAVWLDEGLNNEEPVAINYVEDFIRLNNNRYNEDCTHEFKSFGSWDVKCIKCGEWK